MGPRVSVDPWMCLRARPHLAGFPDVLSGRGLQLTPWRPVERPGEGALAHLDGREQEAHDEVGEPVHRPVHHERCPPGGLKEDLGPHHRGDRTWRSEQDGWGEEGPRGPPGPAGRGPLWPQT